MSGEDSVPKAGPRSARESLGSPLGGRTGLRSDFCLLGNGLNYCGVSRKPAQKEAGSFQRLATCRGKKLLSVPSEGGRAPPSRLLGWVRGKLEENTCICNQMTFGSSKCNERPRSSLLDWARTCAKKRFWQRRDQEGQLGQPTQPVDGRIRRLHWPLGKQQASHVLWSTQG